MVADTGGCPAQGTDATGFGATRHARLFDFAPFFRLTVAASAAAGEAARARSNAWLG